MSCPEWKHLWAAPPGAHSGDDGFVCGCPRVDMSNGHIIACKLVPLRKHKAGRLHHHQQVCRFIATNACCVSVYDRSDCAISAVTRATVRNSSNCSRRVDALVACRHQMANCHTRALVLMILDEVMLLPSLLLHNALDKALKTPACMIVSLSQSVTKTAT